MDAVEPAASGLLALDFANPKYGSITCELWFKEAGEVCEHVARLCADGACDALAADKLLPKEFVRFPLRGGHLLPGPRRSRLDFSRRGLLVYDDASCSLVITLGPCWVDSWWVMGRVVSTGFYNLFLFDDALVEDGCPVYEIKVASVRMVDAQGTETCSRAVVAERSGAVPVSGREPPKKANATLLSFQSSDDDKEEEGEEDRMKSSHDVLDDPRLAKESVRVPAASVDWVASKPLPTVAPQPGGLGVHIPSVPLDAPEPPPVVQSTTGPAVTAAVDQSPATGEQPECVESVVDSAITDFLTLHPRARIGKRSARADADTLLALNSFCTKLRSASSSSSTDVDQPSTRGRSIVVCRLHGLVSCGSCVATFGVAGQDDDALQGSGWMWHKLQTDKLDYLTK